MANSRTALNIPGNQTDTRMDSIDQNTTNQGLSLWDLINIGVRFVVTHTLNMIENVILGKARRGLFHRQELLNELTNEALTSENGTAVARLGLPIRYLHSNLAVIVPKSTSQISDILKAVEKQEKGREILKPLEQMVDHVTMANQTIREGAMTQRRLVTPFTIDVTGFMDLGRGMFSEAMLEWSKAENGIVLLDEIKYLIRSISAKRILGAGITRNDHHIIEQTLIAVRSRMDSASPIASSDFYKAKNAYRLFSQGFVDRINHEIIASVHAGSRNDNFLSEIIKNLTDYKLTGQDPEKYIHNPQVTSAVLIIATLDGIYTNLTSIMLRLLENPDVQAKLYEECINATDDGDSIHDEKIKNKIALPYLHLVYLEGLRFNSSLPYLARYTEHGIQTNETQIPPYSNVLVDLKSMHYNPKSWGDDADQFIPERFLRTEIKDFKVGQVPFIPFSIGQRQCPGSKVGETLIKLFITDFILNYNMKSVPDQPAPRVDNIALAPDPGPGYKVTVFPRVKSCYETKVSREHTVSTKVTF